MGNEINTPNYYAILTADVRYDERLKPNEKLMYAEITALANFRGYCSASNSYFSKLYKVHKNTVGNWVNRLVELGYIRSELIFNDKKQIVARRLYVANIPINEKIDTPINEIVDTYQQKDGEGINEIVEGNNTSKNTTSKNNKNTSSSTDDRSPYSEAFEKWWSIYPRKISKGRAWKTWKQDKLDKRVDELTEKLQQQVAIQYSKTEARFIPHPSTYLNDKRYDDEVEQIKGESHEAGTANNQRKESTMERARREQREFFANIDGGATQGAREDLGFHDRELRRPLDS